MTTELTRVGADAAGSDREPFALTLREALGLPFTFN